MMKKLPAILNALKARRLKLLALGAVVVAAVVASGVAAWLSDGDTQRSEITTGRVDIRLMEDNWNPDAARNVRPNALLERSPRIENVGLNDAYVFLAVEMAALPEGTPLHSGTGMARAGRETPMFTTQASGGAAFDKANWALVTSAAREGRIMQVYAYAKDGTMTALHRGASTTAVFDRVRLANVTDTADLRDVDPRISVTAYAIQTTELGSASTAPLAVWNIVSRYQDSRE